MDKYEGPNAQYKKFVDANPQWQKANIPSSLHDGDYLSNRYSLYDIADNAAAWRLDEYASGFYASSPRANPFSGGSITSVINILQMLQLRVCCVVAVESIPLGSCVAPSPSGIRLR